MHEDMPPFILIFYAALGRRGDAIESSFNLLATHLRNIQWPIGRSSAAVK